ncbi:complement factor D [Daphnia magna]|uniref:complement factor D n=1 Tax=Daphnia magna TaxID=35525 RepID=UPI001E1BA1E5|nr:complement factor D [Daphnia magna]
MKRVFLVIIFIASFQGVPAEDVGRIVNGAEAARGEFPWLVSISENDRHICGGFIYNDRFIVTAASCVFEKAITSLKVKVSGLVLGIPEPGEQNIEVFSVHVHPSYDTMFKLHDLAFVKLNRPIVFGDAAKAIRYEEPDESIQTATIAGWGLISETGDQTQRLQKTTIFNLAANCNIYGINEYSANHMICAGDGTTSPCNYDQGSPLVQATPSGNIVIGIMSKNNGCVSPYPPTIYTRLATYYSWIMQTAGQQPANL